MCVYIYIYRYRYVCMYMYMYVYIYIYIIVGDRCDRCARCHILPSSYYYVISCLHGCVLLCFIPVYVKKHTPPEKNTGYSLHGGAVGGGVQWMGVVYLIN